MKALVGLTAMFCFLLVTDPVWASGVYSNSSTDMCIPSNIQICGISFGLPAAPQGGVFPVTLPDRFVTNSVSVQCVSVYGGPPSYRLANPEMLSCALKTCNPTSFMVCGNSVPVTTVASVGDVVQIPLSTNLVVTDAPAPPIVDARCAVVNGDAHYVADNVENISCNLFLCQPARLEICGSTVAINETARLGAVGQAMTESGQPVTVECLGSEGRAPQFQVIEHACE